MKRAFFCILFTFILTVPFPEAAAVELPENSAHAVMLMHADTGTSLYEQNADEQMLVASTTKIMTALVVLENCLPEDIVEIRDSYCGIEGSSIYLVPGTSMTVNDLLYGLMLASGNDAAVALACHVGGSIEGFADIMNERAAKLGLQNTQFKNPHGLDAQGHYSSARDLAILTAEAMKNEKFEEIVSTKAVTIGELTFANHNKLLWNYEGTLGVKTGYTMAAGRILVSCAQRDGLKLICVTISDPDDWTDHTELFDWGFDNYIYKSFLPAGELARVPVISGELSSVGVAPERDQKLLVKKEDYTDVTIELPRFTYADVKVGEHAGAAEISVNGEVAARVELCYTQEIAVPQGMELTAWEKLKRAWYLSNRYSGLRYGYYGAII